MKGVFVILDGAADEPSVELGGQTALEAANTPNLDYLAERGKIEHCYVVKEGVAPQSSSAVLSLLGYEPMDAPRGQLEAMGAGVKLRNGDLALRTNFVTVDNLEDGNILDKRAGRNLTTREARILAKALNKGLKMPFKFEFLPTIQHRGVLVFRGGFSDNITNADPYYGNGVALSNSKNKIVYSKPLDEEDDSKLSADLVNAFMRHSFKILDEHKINLKRAKRGLFSANFILCRDAGSGLLRLNKLKGKWMALGYMPLEIGIAKATGMEVYKFWYPKFRGTDVYNNLYKGLNKAIKNARKMLKRNSKKYDYFYIHFKETDVPGHDGRAEDKKKMIEILDSEFFSFLRDFIGDAKLVITADHTTSCLKKGHTADPVPVLVYPSGEHSKKRFTEEGGMKGKRIIGRKLLEETLFRK